MAKELAVLKNPLLVHPRGCYMPSFCHPSERMRSCAVLHTDTRLYGWDETHLTHRGLYLQSWALLSWHCESNPAVRGFQSLRERIL